MNYTVRKKRSTTYWQLFLTIVLLFGCLYEIWISASVTPNKQIWLDEVFHFLYDYPFISKIATSVFLLLNVVFLMLFLRHLSLIELRNYYPALFYLLFIFVFPHTMNIWSMLVGFIIIVGVFSQLFGLDEDSIHAKTFTYGLYCGILALIDFYFIFLLIFIYFICLLNRIYTFRSFILPIVGASAAFIYLFAILYLTDSYDLMLSFINSVKEKSISFSMNSFSGNKLYSWICIFTTSILSVVSFFRLLTKTSTVVIHRRKKYYILLFLTLSFAILLFMFRSSVFLFTQVLLILCTIIICMSMSHGKRNFFYKILFFLLLVLGFVHVFLF